MRTLDIEIDRDKIRDRNMDTERHGEPERKRDRETGTCFLCQEKTGKNKIQRLIETK